MNDNQMLPTPQGHTPQVNDNSTLPNSNSDVNHSSTIPKVQPQQHMGAFDSSALPATAGDIDLIEKEWVNKAKAIVASTVGDPKRQSLELSNAKAQYIAKRFNKELPNNE